MGSQIPVSSDYDVKETKGLCQTIVHQEIQISIDTILKK